MFFITWFVWPQGWKCGQVYNFPKKTLPVKSQDGTIASARIFGAASGVQNAP
jgi:hypothetical protein